MGGHWGDVRMWGGLGGIEGNGGRGGTVRTLGGIRGQWGHHKDIRRRCGGRHKGVMGTILGCVGTWGGGAGWDIRGCAAGYGGSGDVEGFNPTGTRREPQG